MVTKDSSYAVEWADNLKVTGHPNRITEPLATELRARAPEERAEPAPRPVIAGEPSYYDIPMLKAPLWKWEIATYFFLGGLSAGAYLIARAADRFGGREYQDVSRVGARIAFATLLPCPLLLIHDLGDRKRFHHMLRVWKPGSPMNLGSWMLVGYGGMVGYEVVRRFLAEHRLPLLRPAQRALRRMTNDPALLLLHDAAGVPFAIVLASYTGVLLSCTSNPLWCKNAWLAPLFTASAVSTGAEALSLTLDLTNKTPNAPAQHALQNIDTAAHVVETAALEGYFKQAGKKAKTLRIGRHAKVMNFARAGILAAEVLKRLPVRERLRKPLRIAAAALGLASGFALRWALVYGGKDAANDPRTARLVSKPRQNSPPSSPLKNTGLTP